MSARLYVIPGSHACRSAMLMLEHKRMPYKLVELPTGAHPPLLRLLGFAGHPEPIRAVDGKAHRALAALDRLGTVPALALDGERVQTNRNIARFLERVEPEPRLFPDEHGLRSSVEDAEAWGDEVLQMAARRLVLAAGARGLNELHERGGRGRLGALLAHSERKRALDGRIAARVAFRADPARERTLLGELPAMLERIDAWSSAGVLGGGELYVADYVIAPSLALLCYRHDLRADIEARPAGVLMERVLPAP